MLGFGDLESKIMISLWARRDATTVREVLGELNVEKHHAYTTVMTVMENLRRKGWLSRERDGQAYRYTPTATREKYVADLMRDVLTSTTDQAAALVYFSKGLTPDESDILRRALRRPSIRKQS